MFPDGEITNNKVVRASKTPERFRRWFKSSVERWQPWRDEAKEDFDFVSGKQWTDDDVDRMTKQGRPVITINKIKPQINVLSGYQRLNRYDIDFLPRTSDDQKLCEVRKGMTKYVMDGSDYEYAESQVFIDGAICGVGWFEVKYDFDYESFDGEAKIKRVHPFGIYPDPESRESDFSDAKFILRARWIDKQELKALYPEYTEDIDAACDIYDKDEPTDNSGDDGFWYQKDTKKLRLVECWYKERKRETIYYMPDGTTLDKGAISKEELMLMTLSGNAPQKMRVPRDSVKVCIFFDEIVMEDIDSPYQHGEFPFVPFTVYRYSDSDTPAGVVRSLKDVQREINKRRSQMLHILNTTANSAWRVPQGGLTPEGKKNLKERGSTPGIIIETVPGIGDALQRMDPPAPPTALFEAGQQCEQDIPNISGINEALMGVQMAASTSGRAIELKQKQAVTQIMPLFDNLRLAKKKLAYLLWGKRKRKGLIPQYYTDAKMYRIIGKNGQQQFVPVNQQVQAQDPMQGTITQTLNDLSQGEFDIVISDVTATATQRTAQFWSMIDASSKLGLQGDMIFDLLLDLSDVPNKDDIIQRWQQRQQQQQQQQQQQAQAQAELAKMQLQEKALSRITYKDALGPVKMLIDAKAGIYGDKAAIAEQVATLMLQQLYSPYLGMATQQGDPQGNQPQQDQQAQEMQAIMQLLGAQQGGGQQQSGQAPQGQPMTQAAAQSIMSGQAPAGI